MLDDIFIDVLYQFSDLNPYSRSVSTSVSILLFYPSYPAWFRILYLKMAFLSIIWIIVRYIVQYTLISYIARWNHFISCISSIYLEKQHVPIPITEHGELSSFLFYNIYFIFCKSRDWSITQPFTSKICWHSSQFISQSSRTYLNPGWLSSMCLLTSSNTFIRSRKVQKHKRWKI